MMNVLLADCLLSSLAAAALLILRRALMRSGFRNRLQRMLRFAALILSLFYLVRALSWLSTADILDRLMLLLAALIPLALLLVTEASLRQHAPRPVKLVLVVAVPALIIGALLLPSKWAQVYLLALLALQLGILAICAFMLWRGAQDLGQAERQILRRFGWLVALSLPAILLDFGFSRTFDGVHFSAAAVIFGVWLIFANGKASDFQQRLIYGGLTFLGLSAALTVLITGRINDGPSLSVFATLLGALVFMAIVALVTERQSDALSDALAGLLSERFGALDTQHVLRALRDRVVMVLNQETLGAMDVKGLQARFLQSPLWAGQAPHEDAMLSDIARTHGATHLICLKHDPLTIAALRLGPAESRAEVHRLMTALARRLEGEAKNG